MFVTSYMYFMIPYLYIPRCLHIPYPAAVARALFGTVDLGGIIWGE